MSQNIFNHDHFKIINDLQLVRISMDQWDGKGFIRSLCARLECLAREVSRCFADFFFGDAWHAHGEVHLSDLRPLFAPSAILEDCRVAQTSV